MSLYIFSFDSLAFQENPDKFGVWCPFAPFSPRLRINRIQQKDGTWAGRFKSKHFEYLCKDIRPAPNNPMQTEADAINY